MTRLPKHIFRQETYAPAVMPQGYTEVNGALMLYLKKVKKLPQDQILQFLAMFVGMKSVPLDQLKTQLAMLQVTETPNKEEGKLIAQYMDNLQYEPERKRIVAQRLKISLGNQPAATQPESQKTQGLTTTHIIIIVVAVVVVLIAIARLRRKNVTQPANQKVVRTNRAPRQKT